MDYVGETGRKGGRLYTHAVDRRGAQEKIVRGVDQHPNRELVDHRHLDRRRRGELNACEGAAYRRPSEDRGAYEKVTPCQCAGHGQPPGVQSIFASSVASFSTAWKPGPALELRKG